jgi:hypothetical protein
MVYRNLFSLDGLEDVLMDEVRLFCTTFFIFYLLFDLNTIFLFLFKLRFGSRIQNHFREPFMKQSQMILGIEINAFNFRDLLPCHPTNIHTKFLVVPVVHRFVFCG